MEDKQELEELPIPELKDMPRAIPIPKEHYAENLHNRITKLEEFKKDLIELAQKILNNQLTTNN
ncbi:hypothetical protein ES705_31250 [subsurface metagenome]